MSTILCFASCMNANTTTIVGSAFLFNRCINRIQQQPKQKRKKNDHKCTQHFYFAPYFSIYLIITFCSSFFIKYIYLPNASQKSSYTHTKYRRCLILCVLLLNNKFNSAEKSIDYVYYFIFFFSFLNCWQYRQPVICVVPFVMKICDLARH